MVGHIKRAVVACCAEVVKMSGMREGYLAPHLQRRVDGKS